MAKHPLVRLWGWPIVLAVLTLFGLVSALLGEDGIWLWLCWLSLAAPVAVIATGMLRVTVRP